MQLTFHCTDCAYLVYQFAEAVRRSFSYICIQTTAVEFHKSKT